METRHKSVRHIKRTFVPNVNPNTVARIKSLTEDTCFIMEQRQPFDMWNPEDNLDLVPYGVWSHGKEADVNRYWKSLCGKIQRAHERESAEIFSRIDGDGFMGIVVIKGADVITYVVCGKQKALELAY